MLIIPTTGITWLLGLYMVNNDAEVFAWVFALLNVIEVCTVSVIPVHLLNVYQIIINVY